MGKPDEDAFDDRIEADAKAGKLDWLGDEAAAEHAAGLTRRLPGCNLQSDGGPAFPYRHDGGDGSNTQYRGMSLRDWFAGQALAGMNASLTGTDAWPTETGTKLMARAAYLQADAMLEARTEPSNKG